MPLVQSAVSNLPTQEEMSQGFVQLIRLNNQQDIYNYIVHLMDIGVPSEQILTQLDNHYYLVQESNEVFRQALKQLDDTGRLKVLFGIDDNYSQEASQRITRAYIDKSVEFILYGLRLTSIPDSICRLSNLQRLGLGYNQLSSLPESIGQLNNLQILNLWGDRLSSLPENICQLANLQHLALNSNELSSLPESIGQLTNLQSLYINNNQLSSLPESIGQLTNLQRLNLSYNQLSSLPENICLLTNLQFLYLDHNRFSIDQLEHIRSLFRNTRTRIFTDVYEEPSHTARNRNAPANVPTDIPSRINYLKQLAGNHNITKNWSNPSVWAETKISQNVHFKTFLERIWEMRDANSNEENLKNMLTVLMNIFAKMESNPEYRGICLQIAEESLEHCGDRIAFGLIQMQIAEKGYPDHNPTLQELFNYEKMCAKVSLIREIAHARIENSHGLIDEIEVYLKYFKDLKTEIDINIGSMLYERLSDLTPLDIENARQQLAEITDDDIFKIMIDNPKVKEILRQEFEDIMSKSEYAETFIQEGETDSTYKTRLDNMESARTQDMVNALKQNMQIENDLFIAKAKEAAEMTGMAGAEREQRAVENAKKKPNESKKQVNELANPAVDLPTSSPIGLSPVIPTPEGESNILQQFIPHGSQPARGSLESIRK